MSELRWIPDPCQAATAPRSTTSTTDSPSPFNITTVQPPIRIIQTVYLKRLAKEYPPHKKWACETEEIVAIWQKAFKDEKLCKTKHIKVTETFLVKEEDFKLVIKEDESCIVIDAETNELVVVAIRNLVEDAKFLEWLDDCVQAACKERSNARREDPGYGAVVGYTSGHWKKPTIGWGEPRHKTTDEGFLRSIEQVVVEDFNRINVPRMDFNRPEHERSGHYQIRRGEEVIEMSGEFAPAAALPGENYARFCHNESNANELVMSLTTSRSVPSTSEEGGHFYVASYGIKIRSAPDTLTAWKARDYHGTTLQHTTPLWAKKATGHYQQRGFAFLIQNRLPGLWRLGKVREPPRGKKWQVGQKEIEALDDSSSEGSEHDTTDDEVEVNKRTDHAAKQQMKREGPSAVTLIIIDSSSESEMETAGESVMAQQNGHLPTARSSKLALGHLGPFRRVCRPVTKPYPSNHHVQFNAIATAAGPPTIAGTATAVLPVAQARARVPSHPHTSTTSATVRHTQEEQMIAADRALIARFDEEVAPHLGNDWEDLPWSDPDDVE
ncbi:MAG: hypothetical protein Q9181_004853 [Wetmoreana brouardii]